MKRTPIVQILELILLGLLITLLITLSFELLFKDNEQPVFAQIESGKATEGLEIEHGEGVISYYSIYISGVGIMDFLDNEEISDDFKRGYLMGSVGKWTVGFPTSIDEYYIKVSLPFNGEDVERKYTIKNFPLEDDCLSENFCFVKYSESSI